MNAKGGVPTNALSIDWSFSGSGHILGHSARVVRLRNSRTELLSRRAGQVNDLKVQKTVHEFRMRATDAELLRLAALLRKLDEQYQELRKRSLSSEPRQELFPTKAAHGNWGRASYHWPAVRTRHFATAPGS